MRKLLLALVLALAGCGSTPAPEPITPEAPPEVALPMVDGLPILSQPIENYDAETQALYADYTRIMADRRAPLPEPAETQPAMEWMRAEMQTFTERRVPELRAYRDQAGTMRTRSAEHAILTAATTGIIMDDFVMQVVESAGAFKNQEVRDAVRQSSLQSLTAPLATARNAYQACVEDAGNAGNSTWRDRCQARLDALPEAPAPRVSEARIPEQCDGGLLAIFSRGGAPAASAEGGPLAVTLDREFNRFEEAEREQIRAALHAKLAELGKTMVPESTVEEVARRRGERRLLAGSTESCARMPTWEASYRVLAPDTAFVELGVSLPVNDGPRRLSLQFPAGHTPMFWRADLPNEGASASDWLQAIGTLQASAQRDAGVLGALMGGGGSGDRTSRARVEVKVGPEAGNAVTLQGYETLNESALHNALARCYGTTVRSHFAPFDVTFVIAPNGSVTDVTAVLNYGDDTLSAAPTECIEEALSQLHFSCTLDGQAASLSANVCVR